MLISFLKKHIKYSPLPDFFLKNNRVDIWLTQPDKMTDPQLLKRYRQLLPPQEQEKIDRYKFAKGKHDALITRIFVRCVLSHYSDMSPQHWRFSTGTNGKPYLEHSPLSFNVSHTDKLIACAVTRDHQIGLDVENITRNSNTYKLAPRYFSTSEAEVLHALPAKLQPHFFYNFWTLKESYIKAVGDGLAIPLNHFAFKINSYKDVEISFDNAREDNPQCWQSRLFDATTEHRMAATIKVDRDEILEWRYFSLTPLAKFKAITLPLSS